MNKEMMTDLKSKYDQKALDILLHMTLEDKVDLMGGKISKFRLVWDMMVKGHYNPVPYPAALAWELEHMVYQAYIGTSSRPDDLIRGSFSL